MDNPSSNTEALVQRYMTYMANTAEPTPHKQFLATLVLYKLIEGIADDAQALQTLMDDLDTLLDTLESDSADLNSIIKERIKPS